MRIAFMNGLQDPIRPFTQRRKNTSAPVRPKTACTKTGLALTACALYLFFIPSTLLADVPTGNAASATSYYRSLTVTLGFSTPDDVFKTKLDDVASYLGYKGITGADLQNLAPTLLMSPNQLLSQATVADSSAGALQHPDVVSASVGAILFRADDILATRFFAPKIMNIRDPESTRRLGWRKLVRLRARPGSAAANHHVGAGIILFNIFTQPGARPFSPTDESVNTQVILVTESSQVPAPNAPGPATLYWLDYGPLSKGGTLSLALNAFFDANELPQSSNGSRPYFVPDGCVACHGNNGQRSLVNYLDTDHWFDRLENDFPALKASGLPLIVDAQTNNSSTLTFKVAFDIIRRFNIEADEQVAKAQPKHDEALASHKWLEVHAANNDHVLPIDRAIGLSPQWSRQNASDLKVLDAMNQYCFRCHGTVKFSVFNRQELRQPQFQALIDQAIKTTTPVGIRMPPDRDLPDDVRSLLHNFTQ
jgi:hypothetical protein